MLSLSSQVKSSVCLYCLSCNRSYCLYFGNLLDPPRRCLGRLCAQIGPIETHTIRYCVKHLSWDKSGDLVGRFPMWCLRLWIGITMPFFMNIILFCFRSLYNPVWRYCNGNGRGSSSWCPEVQRWRKPASMSEFSNTQSSAKHINKQNHKNQHNWYYCKDVDM